MVRARESERPYLIKGDRGHTQSHAGIAIPAAHTYKAESGRLSVATEGPEQPKDANH